MFLTWEWIGLVIANLAISSISPNSSPIGPAVLYWRHTNTTLEMAELLQLDSAASLIGKSEVTLRRLIKAGKIPFQKEKTLTGFVYLVDPDAVRAYYQGRDTEIFQAEAQEHSRDTEPEVQVATQAQAASAKNQSVRVAVSDPKSGPAEYWQKRAEIYEDRFTQEVVKHAQTREDLGVWRGRAEQAQSMLIKLLPAPQSEVEVRPKTEVIEQMAPEKKSVSAAVVILSIFVVILLVGLVYVVFSGHTF